MSLKYTVIPVTPYQQNCSLVWCDTTRQAALIDPGGDIERLLTRVAQQDVNLTKLILTHGHVDHVGGVAALAQRLGLPVEGPQREDDFLIDDLPKQSARFGFQRSEAFTPDRWLEEGDKVQLGEMAFDVLHCPGHTPGHIVFSQAEARIVFVGDVLFKGSIGRTDFPRGDYDTLIEAIKGKLWPLGDDFTVVPGHGPLTTIGHERRANPYVGMLA